MHPRMDFSLQLSIFFFLSIFLSVFRLPLNSGQIIPAYKQDNAWILCHIFSLYFGSCRNIKWWKIIFLNFATKLKWRKRWSVYFPVKAVNAPPQHTIPGFVKVTMILLKASQRKCILTISLLHTNVYAQIQRLTSHSNR